jgi:hypothetical protein
MIRPTTQNKTSPGLSPPVVRMTLYLLGAEMLVGALLMVSTAASIESGFSLEERTRRATEAYAAYEAFSERSVLEEPISPVLNGREVMFF